MGVSVGYIAYQGLNFVEQAFDDQYLPEYNDAIEFKDAFLNTSQIVSFGIEDTTDGTIRRAALYTNTLVIKVGRGGIVNDMVESIRYIQANPAVKIIIDGPCASACTLLLSLPDSQVKYTENATFLFHSSFFIDSVITMRNIGVNKYMKSLFTPEVQKWIDDNEAFESTELTEMTNDEVRQFYPGKFFKSSEIPYLKEIKPTDRYIKLVEAD